MALMSFAPISHEPMRPSAPAKLVLGSLFAALLLNLLPWSGWALLARPDFLLVMLLYWVMYESRNMGQGWGFALGLVMDVADSVLLGQHAFAYVAAVFLIQLLRLRLIQLSLLEQALHVLAILVVAQALNVLLNLSMGRDFPAFSILLSPFFGAILWPFVNVIASLPRFRRRDPITQMG